MKPITEEPVQEDEKEERPAHRAELPLKRDAGRMEMVIARGIARDLRELLERDPGHFQALQAIVEGRPEEASPQQRHELEEWSLLLPDGSPRPNVKVILAAALRNTPDGPAIIDPVTANCPEEAATLRRADEELEEISRKGYGRLWRQLSDHEEDLGQGQSR